MYDDMSYTMLHEMMKKKFNLEADDRINLSVKLPSFDSIMDITDNDEVKFFVECACRSDEISHLYVFQPKKTEENVNFMSTSQNQFFYNFLEPSPVEKIGPYDVDVNTSFFNNNHMNTSFFNDGPAQQFESNDAQSNEFAFGSYDENENEQNDCFDGVDENPQPVYHKWKKFMSFKPDIPETPLYNSKPMISKHYKKDSEVKIGNTFDNKEALDLAVRLKALEEGYQFLSKKTNLDRRVLKGKDIQKDILSQYKTSISYQQAWRGKEYGLEQIRGSPYESFEMLPYYLHNLERKNKGTVTRIKTDEGVFEMLFIALGASIRTFVNHLRPLLIIDAAHLKGQYKGTNLVAVGMDGNNQIVPIAFGICKGETGPCWSWWMSVLKECIGDNPNLLFISDRHASIALAVRNEFPLAFHAVSEEFRSNMDILQTVQLDAYHKLMEVGPQRWSRAHCPLIRYNYMTSNSVESVNACSVLNRKLPITMLTETYREMLQKWYFERREVAANMKHEMTDWVANKLSGIPCGHVIAVTRFLGLTDCVQFVADWFKKENYQGTYAESIHFVGDMHE
ncbi:transposase, MuDR, MULE transposase domain protein [Tanacetum coccineum]